MPEVLLPSNNWRPRDYQMEPWEYLEGGGRRLVAVCHRRWGKDDLALNWTAVSAHQKPATYWHMLPEYAQARKAIWNAVNPHTGKRRIDEAFPHALREKTNDQEMFIRFKCGSTWQVVGSDNYNSLVGSPPYGIVLSEWALADPSAWAYLSPILMENGGWAIFIYTSRGKNHGHSTYKAALANESWCAVRQKAGDTGVFTPEQLIEARAELDTIYTDPDEADAVFEQEYNCSFDAPLPGSYYGKEISRADDEGRIGLAAYNPDHPVYTAWDLGIDDHTAIWFAQIIADQVMIIDYYEVSNQSLIDSAKVVLGQRPIDNRTGRTVNYLYAEHYLPHDVETREQTTALTRKQSLEAVNLKPIRAGSKLPVADGINAARKLIRKARFDSVKAEAGLNALRQYRREYDEKLKTYKKTPKHDWSSHGADAFRELAVQLFDVKGAREREQTQPPVIDYDPFTVGTSGYNPQRERPSQTGISDYNPF